MSCRVALRYNCRKVTAQCSDEPASSLSPSRLAPYMLEPSSVEGRVVWSIVKKGSPTESTSMSYATTLALVLGISESGSWLRAGLAPRTTREEVGRLVELILEIGKNTRAMSTAGLEYYYGEGVSVTQEARLTLELAGRVLLSGFLAALLGLEREVRNKDAGLRTYTMVGLGSALIMVVSQYGFRFVVGPGASSDPARVAAQVVSGIGFLGGGLIFVKGGSVRGLTTAAGLWLSSGIGLAAGAGMIWLSILATVAGLATMYGLDLVEHHLLRSKSDATQLDLICHDKRGVLAQVSSTIAQAGST